MVALRRSSKAKSPDHHEHHDIKRKHEAAAGEHTAKRQKSSGTAHSSKELQVGDKIPDVILKNQDGEDVSLAKVTDETKVVVIYSNPKAGTIGGTEQASAYKDHQSELKKIAKVFGLSADDVRSLKDFQKSQSLPFDVLSDPGRELIEPLGAKKGTSTQRSHWVFLNGKLIDKKIGVSPESSVADAIKAASKAHGGSSGRGRPKKEQHNEEVKDEDGHDAADAHKTTHKPAAKAHGRGRPKKEQHDEEDENNDQDGAEYAADDAEDPELEEIGQEDDVEYETQDLKTDERDEGVVGEEKDIENAFDSVDAEREDLQAEGTEGEDYLDEEEENIDVEEKD
ncbi:thioredoxin peroxidase DOT5 LALA0_S01e10022g [Lachancea lanzarotensis]|uniref:thioredoxin-dependent peroxiredoxin n=1 Tax=Lachancea lanzarotensis TaxID=1245769 RepID=A0A0C7MKS7_9SACH|nr:uncharacterized protein LALA0_S01e10022g [Lachancea lanzarotensis]CEP60403.1 LALA0S01e10022g1_1 [Lachancea lanzarotensis]